MFRHDVTLPLFFYNVLLRLLCFNHPSLHPPISTFILRNPVFQPFVNHSSVRVSSLPLLSTLTDPLYALHLPLRTRVPSTHLRAISVTPSLFDAPFAARSARSVG